MPTFLAVLQFCTKLSLSVIYIPSHSLRTSVSTKKLKGLETIRLAQFYRSSNANFHLFCWSWEINLENIFLL